MTEGAIQMNETNPLPDGWQWVRLGEVCEIIMGQSPPGHTYNRDGKGLPFLQGGVDFGDLYPAPSTWCLQPQKVAQPGDILICVRAPVGPTNLCNEKYCIGRGLAAIRPRDNVDTWFILYYLRLAEKQLADIGRGSTFDAVKREHLEKTLIPLPPTKEEQRRIAGKIQELVAEVERARIAGEAQLEAAKALPKAYLRQVFESEEAKKWERRRLGEVFDVQQGVAMSPYRREGVSPRPFLRTLNVLWGRVDLSTLDKMDFTDEEVSKLSLKPGDLLVCEGGEVGRTAIWRGEIDACLYQNHIHRLRKLNDTIVPEFFMYWMQAAFQVFGSYSGEESITTIPNLSGNRLKSFLVPLPTTEEQRRIALELSEKMANAEKLKATIEKQLEAIKALPQAILRKAFSGEL